MFSITFCKVLMLNNVKQRQKRPVRRGSPCCKQLKLSNYRDETVSEIKH